MEESIKSQYKEKGTNTKDKQRQIKKGQGVFKSATGRGNKYKRKPRQRKQTIKI